MQLIAAGNTVIPAILLIRQMGYTLKINKGKSYCIAKKDDNSFSGEDPLIILGLIKLYEMKGENWMASDNEIEKVLKEIN